MNVAVIKADIFECSKQIDEIRERLLGASIQPIFIRSISDLAQILDRLRIEGDHPFLYLKSPWEWVDFPNDIINLHAENRGFENIASLDTGDRFTYIPSQVFVHNDSLLNFKEKFGKVYTFLVEVNRTIKKPNVEPPRIFLTTHNRNQYLELTLNSLFFSIDETVPVTLLLNEPTENIRRVVDKFKDKSNVDVLEIKNNCFYSSINLAIQWYNPKKFIVCEDDFILPQTAKEFYPNWVYHFSLRLEKCDLVGWSPSIDNAPSYHRFPKDKNPVGEWTIGGKKFSSYPLLLGNCLAMKTEFWKRALNENPNKWHTALDSSLHALAESYCTPSLKGYHIGWNQQMDGFGSLLERDFTPPVKNIVTDLKTGETRFLRLDDLKGSND